MKRPLRHILCIDDEADILEVTRICLQTVGGFEVTSCASGAEGIILAQERRPDLALVDVMMPLLDGPGTLRRMRAHPDLQRIPVIFMTARVQPAEIEDYRNMGAAGVIRKPFDPMTLCDEICAVWDRYSG